MEKFEIPSLTQWNQFHEVNRVLKAMEPWNFLDADNCISMQLVSPRENVICSVLGSAGECTGVAVFPGGAGFYDYYRIQNLAKSTEDPLFVKGDMDCITLYWGNREGVPSEQKAAMKDLGLKFRGNGNWPYVISYHRRFLPASPSAEELELLTEVLGNLIMVVRAVAEERLGELQFDNRMLHRCYDPKSKLWHMGWVPKIEIPENLGEMRLEDKQLRKHLSKAPRMPSKMIVDLMFPSLEPIMKKGIRLEAPLFCCMLDETRRTIVCADIIPDDMPIEQAILSVFVGFVTERGRMKQIRVRNPLVITILSDVCRLCKIPLIRDSLPEMDEIRKQIEEDIFG